MDRLKELERQKNIATELYSIYANIKYMIQEGNDKELCEELEKIFKEFNIGVITVGSKVEGFFVEGEEKLGNNGEPIKHYNEDGDQDR